MNLTISGHHLEVTSAIREYVITKLTRIQRHSDHIIDIHVTLSIEPLRHTAEVTMRLQGKDIHCEAQGESLYAAIDLLADKLDRQLIKHKTKIQSHTAEPIKRQASSLHDDQILE